MFLSLNYFLQSLISVPPLLVCTEVCVPPIQQDLLVVPITQLFLAEFDQCASSPCMHRGVCASHPTGPVCILYLSLNNSFLQSLTSVSPPLVCTEVCVPPIQQDLLVCAYHSIISCRVRPVCLLSLYARRCVPPTQQDLCVYCASHSTIPSYRV